MSTGQHTAVFRVTVDGRALPDEVATLLERAEVDDGLSRPAFVQLVFRDPERELLTRAGLAIGASIGVDVVTHSEPGGVRLADAEVVALGADLDATGTHTVVRAADRSHRLRSGACTATYRQVSVSEVVAQVAERRGIEVGRLDVAGPIHDHLAQVNETDWTFLRRLVADLNCDLAVVEGRLEVHAATRSDDGPPVGSLGSEDPLELVAGEDLLRLRASVRAAEQVPEVTVRGWDPTSKSPITARADADTTTASFAVSPKEMAEALGALPHLVAGASHQTQEQADLAAAAVADRLAGTSVELDGHTRGNAALRAGRAVSLGLLGAPFDGRYTLTSTRHRFDPVEGYTTTFTVSGREERPMGPHAAHCRGLAMSLGAGVAVGLVTAVDDPEALARVRVSYPWLADDHETDWARTVQPGAGPGRGAVVVPEVGDEVLVSFENGDPRRPYVLGGLHNGVDTPGLGEDIVDTSTGAVRRRAFVSRHKHAILFCDDDRDDGITLATGDGALRVSLDAGGGVLRLSSQRDLEIVADGRVRIEGSTVEIAGQPIKLN